jgi:hypothetical protein
MADGIFLAEIELAQRNRSLWHGPEIAGDEDWWLHLSDDGNEKIFMPDLLGVG